MSSSIKEYLTHLNTVYNNSLDEDEPSIETPPELKLPLHIHQRGVIAKMEKLEHDLMTGLESDGQRVFSNYGILGDSVGVGKSLMVLGHIARINSIPPLLTYNTISSTSSTNFFSIKTKKITDLSEAGCLLVIPHTLFRQWSDYISGQTTLKAFCVARTSQIVGDDFYENIYSSDVVLISNTNIKPFIQRCNTYGVRWKRLFIDEADTIHLPGITMRNSFKTRFIWFITASWMNMLYLNNNLYFDKVYVHQIMDDLTASPLVKNHFKSRSAFNAYYYIEALRVKSYNFLREILSVSHPARSNVIIRCSEEYVKKSISLPPLIKETILCRAPASHSILKSVVSPVIQQMLHAGDTEGALSELGVKGQTTKELIEAVTTTLKKELERLQKTYEFKESLEYSSAAAKETALKSLKEKIANKEFSIKSIQERIESFKNSICPICLDDPKNFLITPCCSQAFCPPCLLLTISVKPVCPICRSTIHPSKCKKLVDESTNQIVDDDPLPKKTDALINILKNPGKFLIFSRYENPFEALEGTLDEMGIKVKHLKGNKDAIHSTLTKFEKGDVKCLLLNSQFAGSGLNITAATHVILLHAMTHEEEKQILGRAYRVGREGPLTFIKLLHEDEENYSEN